MDGLYAGIKYYNEKNGTTVSLLGWDAPTQTGTFVGGDNPWGEGATTLEWTLPSPPPFHQFETLPRIAPGDHH